MFDTGNTPNSGEKQFVVSCHAISMQTSGGHILPLVNIGIALKLIAGHFSLLLGVFLA